MLKCLIVPLLVSSITSAIGSLDLSMSKKIAFRAIIYYFTTTVCAVILGIILVSTIRPGAGREVSNLGGKATTRQVLTADTLLDLVRYVSEGGIGAPNVPKCLDPIGQMYLLSFLQKSIPTEHHPGYNVPGTRLCGIVHI